ncbi:hypothetical protein BCR39DRAFT_549724 [Naematelia encephala]|uniref:Actin cortical patch SUR7/pH-response regulator pali n=1 Tax=Naematelia encephala TaxID=71784 RepID=A0A1Y2AKV1_9TREE|nr:hypothetical protein BCR39DRAFT_549724 [Naematelia encephala]
MKFPSKMKLDMKKYEKYTHHPILSQTIISLGLTGLSLLLLVLVLLSVPGPIKGLYWFSVPGETSGVGDLTAGVLGWCETATSNCTYAPLSDNHFLSTLINTGEALTVRIMLPLACYWAIVVLVFWVLLTVLTPIGYAIKDLDSITRHLRFAIIEACVLCVTLFGNVLSWLAFGLGREAYLSVKNGGGTVHSGRAMETTAVAALMSLFSLFAAIWGLHLRVSKAQTQWKEEAVMVRRRSMAMLGNSNSISNGGGVGNLPINLDVENGHVGIHSDPNQLGMQREKNDSTRWSDAPSYSAPQAQTQRFSIQKERLEENVHSGIERGGEHDDEEERLDAELATAKRNSVIHKELISRRAS